MPSRTEPSILVVHNGGDPVAVATGAAIARLGAAVEMVRVEELALRATWSHRLIPADGVHTTIELSDGRRLHSDAITGVFNRVRFTPGPFFPRPRDREYALMEMFALLLSWLHGLRAPVVNRPSPRGLAGSERTLFEWLGLAAESQLPTRQVRLTTNGREFHLDGLTVYQPPLERGGLGRALEDAVPPGPRPVLFAEKVGSTKRAFVVGERTFDAGEVDPAALRRFAAAAECTLLEVQIAPSICRSEWVVCGADPFPVGLPVECIEALASWLASAARASATR